MFVAPKGSSYRGVNSKDCVEHECGFPLCVS
jgi:hypothetical protein